MESRMTVKKNLKEDLKANLDDINNWIVACDNKTSILLAFVALLTGLTTNIFDSFNIIKEYFHDHVFGKIVLAILIIIMLCLYCVFLFFIIFYLINVLKARKKPYLVTKEINEKSTLFFSDMSSLKYENYNEAINQRSDEKLIDELKKQIFVNSKIADKKHEYFNKAIKLIIPLFSVVIILLILINILR